MRKIRVLLNSEFSQAKTGYGVMSNEILSRLHNTGEFELAELAAYCQEGDPRQKNVPWKVYPNVPHPDDKVGQEKYASNSLNQFGRWKWEEVCLDFKPDVCFSFRDNWYDKYMIYSPFRRLYRLYQMPTVDSYPLNDEWVGDYLQLDGCLAYTSWGESVLKSQCGPKLKFKGLAPPGVNTKSYFPLPNKKRLKQSVGLSPDALVVGMVARNQMRKLFPDLFESIAKYIVDGPSEITSRLILYLHTAWPDLGWNIPKLIKEFGLGNRFMVTYVCNNENCRTVFPSFFQDTVGICKKCGSSSATTVNANLGIPENHLNIIYNLFDVYVQLACAEGIGISQLEATAAGVPVLSVNYSGMVDVINKLNAIPIDVIHFNKEVTTGRYMAIPDLEDFIIKLDSLLKLPSSVRAEFSYKNIELVKNNFDWDKSTETWINCFRGSFKNWKCDAKILTPNLNIPQNLNNEQFVKWSIANVLCMPEMINSYLSLRMLRDLNWGHANQQSILNSYFSEENCFITQPKYTKFTRETAIQELLNIVDVFNNWEMTRIKQI